VKTIPTLEDEVMRLAALNWCGKLEVKWESGNIRSARKTNRGYVRHDHLGAAVVVLEELSTLRGARFFGDTTIEFFDGTTSMTVVTESVRVK
jgi:hypothetical protein